MKFSVGSLSSMIGAIALSSTMVNAQDSILDIITDNPSSYDTLLAAVNAAGLGTILDDPNLNATLFAPNKAAFGALPAGLLARLISDDWLGHLGFLLASHLVPEVLPASSITDGLVKESDSGLDIDFSVASGGAITLNPGDAEVDSTFPADNGIVHGIDAVLTPEFLSLSIYDLGTLDPDFSTLISLADLAMLNGTLSTLGANDAGYTLFAPTNAGITAFLNKKPWLQSKFNDEAFVSDFLLYHVVGSILLPAELAAATTIMAVNGGTLNVDAMTNTEGDLVGTVQSASFDSFTFANNGVVHVIDEAITAATIVDVLLSYPADFSDLVAFAVDADLAETLDTGTNLTLFAPTNLAIAALETNPFFQNLDTDMFITHLKNLLLYHVIGDAVITSDMITDGAMVTSLSGEVLSFAVEGMGEITINNSSMPVPGRVNLDAPGNPGVVHGIDAVLLPSFATHNIVQVATAAGAFNTLLAQATKFPAIVSILTGTAGYTLFAPNDVAFTKLETNFPKAFATILANNTILETILKAHVVAGVKTVEQITSGEKVDALSMDELTLTKAGDVVTVNGLTVATGDVLANNGVIHVLEDVIDSAMFPVSALNEPDATMAPSTSPSAAPSPAVTSAPTDMPTAAPTSDAFRMVNVVELIGLAGAIAGMLML